MKETSRFYESHKHLIESLKWDENGDSTARHIHDWERYIPREYRQDWKTLPWELKTGMYIVAEEAASAEEWD